MAAEASVGRLAFGVGMGRVVKVRIVRMLDDKCEAVAFDEKRRRMHLRTEEHLLIPLPFVFRKQNTSPQTYGVAFVAGMQMAERQ